MKIALVCSHGGHLVEILQLTEAVDGHDIFYITYRAETTKGLSNAYLLEHPGMNPLRLLWFAVRVVWILAKERPGLVLSTGAEIAILPFYIAKFLFGAKLIYVECSSQVVNPSRTGRIVSPVTDLFLVQWQSLVPKYNSKAEYRGGLI